MAGATLTVDTREIVALGTRFQELMRRAADLTPLMDEIGASLVSSVQHRFEGGRGPGGVAWPQSGRAKAEGGQTLIDRGHLRDSITHRPGRDQVEIGTNLVYAGIHQFGGRIQAKSAAALKFRIGDRWISKKAVDIPARPFLGVDDEDAAEISAIVGDWLAEPLQ